MKLILDIQNHKASFFMELLQNFNYVKAKALQSPDAENPEIEQQAAVNMQKKINTMNFFIQFSKPK